MSEKDKKIRIFKLSMQEQETLGIRNKIHIHRTYQFSQLNIQSLTSLSFILKAHPV